MIAYASTIVYMPDPVRGESFNVGVALVAPSMAYARMRVARKLTSRLRAFDPAFHPVGLERVGARLQARLRALEGHFADEPDLNAEAALSELVRTSGGSKVMLTAFHPVFLEGEPNRGNLDLLLVDFFVRDVHWRRKAHKRIVTGPRSELKSRVADLLDDKHLLGDVPGRVQQNYKPRGASLDLPYDFGFKNGVHHVMMTADLSSVTSDKTAVKSISSVAGRLGYAKGAAEGETPKCYALVGGERRPGERVAAGAVGLLRRNADFVFFVDEDQDQRRLVKQIREAFESS